MGDLLIRNIAEALRADLDRLADETGQSLSETAKAALRDGVDHAGLDVKLALIMTGSGILPRIGMFIPLGIAQTIRLFIEHSIEGIFDRLTDHRIQVRMNLSLINFDNLVQVLFQFCRCLLVFHFKPFL